MAKIYILRTWVDFPVTEYGGMIAVIAENDDDCIAFLEEKAKAHELGYGSDQSLELIPQAVSDAKSYPLEGEFPEPLIVDKFMT